MVRTTLEKVVRDAITNNKYKAGIKEVSQSIKGSKLIIISESVAYADKSKLEEHAKVYNIPIYMFDGSSTQLAKICNKPFRISAIALKSSKDDEINSLLLNHEKKSKTERHSYNI